CTCNIFFSLSASFLGLTSRAPKTKPKEQRRPKPSPKPPEPLQAPVPARRAGARLQGAVADLAVSDAVTAPGAEAASGSGIRPRYPAPVSGPGPGIRSRYPVPVSGPGPGR